MDDDLDRDATDAELRRRLRAMHPRPGGGSLLAALASVEERTNAITRRRRIAAVASSALLLGLAATAAYAVTSGEDRETVSIGALTTMTSEVDTTGSTAAPETSTSTATATSTTTTAASTTSTAPATTTSVPAPTTTPPPTLPAGIVTSLPLRGDGIGPLRFGTPFADVEAHLTATLGPPTDDTGWYDGTVEAGDYNYMYDCPDEIATIQRVLRYDRLEIEFIGHSPDDARFAAYNVLDAEFTARPDGPETGVTWDLATPSGIHAGMPYADLPRLDNMLEPEPHVVVIADDGGEIYVLHELYSGIDKVLAISTPTPCPNPPPPYVDFGD